MTDLELLSPARNADIGIAAIDCGADAVYIAGPAFGARAAAGNSIEEIRRLCAYAHRFGVRIYVTFNTILYEEELPQARRMLAALEDAGADALIVQDLAVARLAPGRIPLHASTQCAIRTPEQAAFYEGLGFTRLVLERELSLREIRAIRNAVRCELECFVHGALCVCYSGQCYLSEYLDGRSANRGACIQACRSRYDLTDGDGKVLLRDKAILSLKDLNLLGRIDQLAAEGICSFKIEGRLKNASYVKNVVKEYSTAIDGLIAREPQRYRRASFGRVEGGFTPDPAKTFNRGYTQLYLDGRRGDWAAMDTPRSVGEPVGTIRTVRAKGPEERDVFLTLRPGVVLANGDGFSVAVPGGLAGFRGEVCEGDRIRTRPVAGLREGQPVYRNYSAAFERTLERQTCRRLIPAVVDAEIPDGETILLSASTQDGRTAFLKETFAQTARQPERLLDALKAQLSRSSGDFAFTVGRLQASGAAPMMSLAQMNALRRTLAERLAAEPCRMRPIQARTDAPKRSLEGRSLSYKANVANSMARAAWTEAGAGAIDPAYELAHPAGAELMRTRYCVRYQTGRCPKQTGRPDNGPLYLLNNGRRLRLDFDCARCEMTVKG